MASFTSFLEALQTAHPDARKAGVAIEPFIRDALLASPSHQFVEAWLWDDWPGRDGVDTGIDIVAVDVKTSLFDLINVVTKEAHSRVPIYRDNLDHVTGMVHIKDVLAWRGEDDAFSLPKILRKVLFVSPSMQVLELLLEMRAKRTHMAMVVDEFGGVDGLVTIEDLVEEIVGEIEDEHDRTDEPELVQRPDGSVDADARAALEELQNVLAPIMGDEEWEDSQTLGGLVVDLAGRVPIRGELITHASGIEFQILDADPRRVKRVRVCVPNTGPDSEMTD